MGDTTTIEWTRGRDGKAGHTWNPWQGCHKVSAGCANCYMFAEKTRYGQRPDVVVRSKPATFNAPRKWRDPAFVFTCSWSDFFIEEADAWRDEAWDIIRATPHLTYQILTKRPERMKGRVPSPMLPNVWLGVTAEDQRSADERIPHLLAVWAPVRFLSCEPLLGPIDIDAAMYGTDYERRGLSCFGFTDGVGEEAFLQWVIVGGESGPGARRCDVRRIRSVIEQCRAANVPVFCKQLGARPVGTALRPLCLKNRKGADPAEWPEDLRVREMPEVNRG